MNPILGTLALAPVNGGFRREDSWIWCGSVVEGDDGLFHMFASMWEKSVPFVPNWVTNSRVVRAVSATPEGPYTYREEILPPRGSQYWDGMVTHNPTIHRWRDRYLLFYTGTTYRAERPTADVAVSEDLRIEARGNQRIGVAVASSPEGPWRRPDRPCLDVRPGQWDSFLVTNPAPCVLDSGEVLLLYKATSGDHSPIRYGVAWANSPEGPYERRGADAPITFQDPSLSYEDACIWKQDGRFYMIFNDLSGKLTGEDHAGALAVSTNGVDWVLHESPKAYSRKVRWSDGRTTRQGSLERPQLLFRHGRPTHLFAATADGPGGHRLATSTWNMVIPLEPPAPPEYA
ncbi:MAG: glycoside hydrolase family protein [Verrucomicrobiota bacterium]